MKMPLIPSGLSTSAGLARGLGWEILGALGIGTRSIPGGQRGPSDALALLRARQGATARVTDSAAQGQPGHPFPARGPWISAVSSWMQAGIGLGFAFQTVL